MLKGSFRVVVYIMLILISFSALVFILEPLTNSVGMSLLISIIISAITVYFNRKRFRTGLFSSNSGIEFKQMMFSLAEPVISTDKLGNITRVNKFAEALTGYSYKELRGRNISLVLNLHRKLPGNNEMYNPAADLYKNKQDYFKVSHIEFRDKSGIVHNVSVLISKVKNEFGKEKGAVITFTEINEEQINEYEILKSKREINLLLANMNEGFFLIDSNGKIRDWSIGTEDITGISSNEVINKMQLK